MTTSLRCTALLIIYIVWTIFVVSYLAKGLV